MANKCPFQFPKFVCRYARLSDRLVFPCVATRLRFRMSASLIRCQVHDTFPKPKKDKTLWVSCKSLELAHKLKKEVNMAGGPSDVPPSCECVAALRAVLVHKRCHAPTRQRQRHPNQYIAASTRRNWWVPRTEIRL
eukprot:5452623-Pleurochrysis_carterae.AAC.5